MFTLIVLGLVVWFVYRHLAKKKRAADRRNWSLGYRSDTIRPVTRRLPWKELK